MLAEEQTGCQSQLLDLDGIRLDPSADVSEFAKIPASPRDERRRHGIITEPGAGMERAEPHLRMMIERISALAWSCRPDGSIDFLNRQWIDYTGPSAAEALGWGWKSCKRQ